MTPDQDAPLDQVSLSDSAEMDEQVAQLIRLVQSGEETNIALAFLLAEGLGIRSLSGSTWKGCYPFTNSFLRANERRSWRSWMSLPSPSYSN